MDPEYFGDRQVDFMERLRTAETQAAAANCACQRMRILTLVPVTAGAAEKEAAKSASFMTCYARIHPNNVLQLLGGAQLTLLKLKGGEKEPNEFLRARTRRLPLSLFSYPFHFFSRSAIHQKSCLH
jgi:hypothetical protein